ncbi:30S ribosomal protein S20 [Bacillus solimangrovi]|uniref:Small ribosomal subunit protein bS20 n=1 Tax=Bacillus solimangrovi TaxID=1305675 RepID=A0A1E5LHX2_9BACI|nr:30S ribosomal protein S20 [Bacillus solimangrovi]OEH93683.1 30S ribosomal protein S20 [Bacillus solimangrovi]
MPNIKSAIKRVKTNNDRRARNIAIKSDMRSSIKQFEKLAESKDVENAQAALQTAVTKLDKAARKGLVHRNKADRQKSRLTKIFNEISA